MIKFILTGLLVYFVYRFFIAPPVIDQHHPNDGNSNQQNRNNTEDEYIDYEEVD